MTNLFLIIAEKTTVSTDCEKVDLKGFQLSPIECKPPLYTEATLPEGRLLLAVGVSWLLGCSLIYGEHPRKLPNIMEPLSRNILNEISFMTTF